MPNPEERLAIWKSTVPGKASLSQEIDLKSLSVKYELSGSAIVSVIHYASLQAICRNDTVLSTEDVLEGIRREYEKEEKVFH